MAAVTRRALRVYSALSELKGGDQDVLSALIPFFEPILQVMNGKVFDPHIFAAGVRKLYKWRFTGDIAEAFVPRLQKQGYLKRLTSSGKGNVWGVQYSPTNEDGAQSITSAFKQIVDEFEKFPPRVTDLLTYNRSRDELEDILIRFLVSMDTYGEGAYLPQLGELEPNGEAREILADLEEGGKPLDPGDRYMCARFIASLLKTRPDLAPHLSRLSSIGLLTEVVEDFLKPTVTEAKVELTIALDAPIALDFLGCSGKNFKDDIRAVVRAMQSIGAKFIVFPTSCVEMQRNLRSMLALPKDQRRGYTHNALIKREVSEDFVRAVSNDPERALANEGIEVRPLSLDSFPNSHRFFSKETYEDFFSSIQWVPQVPAREHDATSVALIMRLRDGKHSSDLFKSRYVMVTRNSTFVRQSRSYCIEGRMINHMQEGPVIYQKELATTAWLRTGLGADDSIPKGHLIASCDRVLQVRPEVRNALANQLSLITPERISQLNLLMQDVRSVQKLADQTLNNEKVITAENAEVLLDAMREATAEELTMRFQKVRDAEAELYRKEQEAAATQLAQLEAKLAQSDQLANDVKLTQAIQVRALVDDFNRKATRTEVIVTALLLIAGSLGIVNYFTGYLQGLFAWAVIGFTIAVLSGLRLIFAILERPMPGVVTGLNLWAKSYLAREGLRRGIPKETVESSVNVSRGRLQTTEVDEEVGLRAK